MKKNIRNGFIIAFLLLMAVSLRSVGINRPLYGDEAMIFNISRQNFNRIIPLLGQLDAHPPLSYIFLHYLMKISLFEIWIRLYFVIFGTGVCFLLYLIAREYLDEISGRIAMLLSVLSPLLIFTSQYVRSYIDSAFWMLLSSLFLLRIVQGKGKLIDWTGYAASAIIGLYTFYGSILLIAAQAIYITVFNIRNIKFLLRWYLVYLLVFLVFLPWLPVMFKQFSQASGMHYDWSDKGFNLGILRPGLYTRNIFGIMGLDPNFMSFREGASGHFPKPLLIMMVITGFAVFALFSSYVIKYLKRRFPDNRMKVYFLPFLIILPLFFSWISTFLFNMLPNAKYLVTFHALFLIAVAAFLRSLWERKKTISVICTGFFIFVYLIRFPAVVAAEAQTKEAISYLQKNSSASDCLLCIRSCPEGTIAANVINIGSCFKLNEKKSEYAVISYNVLDELKTKISYYKRVWFYRVYGNIEVFGANSLLNNWLEGQGYKAAGIKRLKNIDIIEFIK